MPSVSLKPKSRPAMAKDPSHKDTSPWVPVGLKVRAGPALQPSQQSEAVSQMQMRPPVSDAKQTSTQTPSQRPAQKPAPKVGKAAGFEPMPILTLVTLLCLGILLWLGSWQWEKFVEKSSPEATQVAALEPTSVTAALEVSEPEYRPVIVDGIMDSRTIKVIAVQDAVRGYRLFSPVLLEAGGIFVDRGFVSEENLARVPQVSGQVSITGVLRTGAKANAYTPDNEPASDVWYWPDLKTMADTLVIQSTSEQFYVAQAQVDPMGTGSSTLNPYGDRKGANQIPPERHLGYAATWWGFGIALLGVYIGMHMRAGRLRFKRQP